MAIREPIDLVIVGRVASEFRFLALCLAALTFRRRTLIVDSDRIFSANGSMAAGGITT